jgi:hypothetical protein
MTATEPLAAVEIATGLWQLPLPIHRHNLGGANAFLIRDADGYVLFDCGADVTECSEALARQLGGLGVPVDAIHTLACDLTRWQDGVAPVGEWLLGGRAATRAAGTRIGRFWHARAATEAAWTYQNSPPADLVRPSLREGSLTNPASASPGG